MTKTYKNLSLVLITLFLISSGGITQMAHAGGPNALYSISVTTINGSNPQNGPFGSPITLVGSASGINFIGTLSQYHVEVNWGDGVIDQSPSWLSLVQEGEDFSGTWTSTHYYNQTGSFDITVKLYHTQPPGAGGTADAVYTQTGIEISSTTLMTLSKTSPQVLGTSVTASASVLPIDATGTIQFQIQTPSSATWSTFDTVPLTSASAISIAYQLIQVGTYKFQAAYSGDIVYKASTSSSAIIVVNPTLIVSIDPSESSITVGESKIFTASAQYGSGTYTNYAWYLDSNPTPVQNGLTDSYTYSTTTAGQHTISVTVTDSLSNTASNSAAITINPASSSHIDITAPTTVTAGQSFQITATAKDQYGNIATSYDGTIHFSSTDSQAILPYDSTLTSGTKTFTITLKTVGQQTITATDTLDNTIFGTSNPIVVEANTNQVGYILITPSTSSISAGSSQTYTAELFDSYDNSLGYVTKQVAWSINSGDGTYTWTENSVKVDKAGNWIVTASYPDVQDATATVTVTGHTAPTSITIQPKTSSIPAGQPQSYTATATDGLNTWDITSIATWTIPSSAGGHWTGPTYTSEKAGTWIVTASLSDLSDTATLTVNPNTAQIGHIIIQPKEQTIAAGQSQSFTATAYDTFENSWDITIQISNANGWSINPEAEGSWSGSTYTSQKAGDWTIKGTYLNLEDTAILRVTHSTNPENLDHITASIEPNTVEAPNTATGTATAYDIFGNSWDISTQATWNIPQGNDGGSWTNNIYQSHTAGTFIVQTTYLDKTAETTITVTHSTDLAYLNYITITPKTQSIAAGETQEYTAMATDSFENSWDISTDATWSIPNGNDNGSWNLNQYTSKIAGTYTIQATYQTKTDTATLTVTANPQLLDHIVIDPKNATITAGNSQTYSTTAYDQFNNSLGTVTSETTFEAPGTTVTGNTITAKTASVYTVTAAYNGKTDAATLNVKTAPQNYMYQQDYPFTFIQTGLPNGKTWSATLNGQTKTSTGSTITFIVPAGVYSFSVQIYVSDTSETRYAAYGLNAATIRVPDMTSYNIKYSPQYKLTIISDHGSPIGDDWYFAKDTANFSITSPDMQDKTRYVFTTWSGNLTSTSSYASILMNAPKTIIANWNTQYYLTLLSKYGNPTGQGWYNEGATAQFSIQDQTTDPSGVQYAFTSWNGTGTDAYTGQDRAHAVTMNAPITETANWEPATSLYSVLIVALIVFIIIAVTLLITWKRRKNKKQSPNL
jgi:hypothetical protein